MYDPTLPADGSPFARKGAAEATVTEISGQNGSSSDRIVKLAT